jgi:SAM-dependent methyltransferase
MPGTLSVVSPPVHARAAAFGDAAEAYEAGRPGWSAEAVDVAAARLGLSRGCAVLDLAAGTGKLTRELVERFSSVTAVEPLDGMRAVLSRVAPEARVLPGTAEAIPLGDASVDGVFVAEAFHWFDAPRAVAEIARVLRPGGGVAVLYNRRDYDSSGVAWERECHDVFEAHMLPPDDVDAHDETAWKAALREGIGPLREDSLESSHVTDAAGIEAAYASFSRLAALPPDRRRAALAAIRDVLVRHDVGKVEITYRTTIVTAAPADGTSRTRP